MRSAWYLVGLQLGIAFTSFIIQVGNDKIGGDECSALWQGLI